LAPPINFGIKRDEGFSFTPRPIYSRRNRPPPVPIKQEGGGAQNLSGRFGGRGKTLPLPGTTPSFLSQAISLFTIPTEYCGELKQFNKRVFAGVKNTYAGFESRVREF